MERRVSVLVVEDDPGAVALTADALRDDPVTSFLVDRVDRLSSAVDWLRRRTPAVVLLDLNLPDSRGLDTLVVLRTHAPRTPFVVLTADDSASGVRAMQAGAQDFLPKDRFDAELLRRSLRYAVERQSLLNEIEGRRTQQLRADELGALGAFSAGSGPVVSHFFGTRALRLASKEVFASLVRRYGEALALIGDDPHVDVPEAAKALIADVGKRLGVLNAGPHDALEVHAFATEVREHLVPEDTLDAFRRSSGRALVHLLSDLAAHYRHYIVDLDHVTA